VVGRPGWRSAVSNVAVRTRDAADVMIRLALAFGMRSG
jgi:hypothetical protein